ncbi:hypothetical protein [Microbacterium sp. NPDC056052]|uniref:hypothetical protein n=1 Tax=Microbacterium sp. NPDC056052 TaxID=3345695 RepID=UPI0035D5D711
MTADADAVPVTSRRGLPLVLAATAISAASSFVILLIVAPALGPAGYASFSVFWAALFMLVGVLFGVQQEATRAVADAVPRDTSRRGASLVHFAVVLGGGALAILAATGPLWAEPVFGAGHTVWAFPLAIAVASYVGVAAVNGVLAGSANWSGFALVPLVDGVSRLVLVGIVLLTGADTTALCWAVAVPFPLSLVVVALFWRSGIARHSVVGESYGRLTANVARTVVASAANAVLVNGFPVVLALFGGGDRAALGAVVLALTLTRAPILVPLTALQSMLITRFSASSRSASIRFALLLIGCLAVFTAFAAFLAALCGEAVFAWLFGDGFALDGMLLGFLVGASGCLGVLTVTGASVLAAKRHTVFATGWVLACVLSVVLVAVFPGDIGTRTVAGLIGGPLIGASWHAAFGWRR